MQVRALSPNKFNKNTYKFVFIKALCKSKIMPIVNANLGDINKVIYN